MKQQLLVISRSRKRAPNLSVLDRFLLGFCSLLLSPHHILRSAIIIRPSTLLRFHEALKKRKYRLLYTSCQRGKPGPKVSSQELILVIVEMKRPNPGIDGVKSIPYTPCSHPFIERLIGSVRRDFLDQTLFWNAVDLERKPMNYQTYCNLHRTHRSLGGDTPAEVAGIVTKLPIKLKKFRWQTHCRGIYQLPIAA